MLRKLFNVFRPRRKLPVDAIEFPKASKDPRGLARARANAKVGELIASASAEADREKQSREHPLAPAQPFPGVVPKLREKAVMALDATPYGYINSASLGFVNQFPGYAYLAELTQVAEYRKMSGTIAEEMTREWIELISVNDDEAEGRADRIAKLTDAIREKQFQPLLRKALELEGYFGRVQIYIEMTKSNKIEASDDPVELASRLSISPKKIARGSFKGIRVVEPMWSYPGAYNATNPLKADYYVPQHWYVMGLLVHRTRLMTIVSHPVPDMLKPAYAFGGISLSQLAMPYVNNWLRTRQSVSDAIHSFSTSGILTDLQAWLAAPVDDGTSAPTDASLLDPARRAQLFNVLRDNKGCMVLDKDSEEFFQFNMPLSGLSDLQAQAQEHMCSVSAIPLVKFTGITPSGLNASSDGEIRVWYDSILSRQERNLRPVLKYLLDILQLSEFGTIDAGIDFRFKPLYQLSELEKATARKTDADTDAVLITSGVISAQESRERVANDPDSPYADLEVDDVPENDELAEPEEEEGDIEQRADTRTD